MCSQGPITGIYIQSFCAGENPKKEHYLHSVHELEESGANIHWIGPRIGSTTGNILLYLHGQGYCNPLRSHDQLTFAMRCAELAAASLAMLEYSLPPPTSSERFPTQLNQAVASLSHLLSLTPASKITIAGDSAGAHLVVGLLSHITHPSKDIIPLQLSEKIGGFCLISPFLSFNYNKESYFSNAENDFLTLQTVKNFNKALKPEGMTDYDAGINPYISPLDAREGWWRNLPVDKIILTMGSWELFRDDCVAFGKRLEKEAATTGTQVHCVLGANEVHASPVIDRMCGLLDGETTDAVEQWMIEAKMTSSKQVFENFWKEGMARDAE